MKKFEQNINFENNNRERCEEKAKGYVEIKSEGSTIPGFANVKANNYRNSGYQEFCSDGRKFHVQVFSLKKLILLQSRF